MPVPMVGSGLPVASLPSDRILLLLWEPDNVMSQLTARRSITVALNVGSSPVFCTDDRFLSTDSVDAPEDAAIG